MCQAYDLCTFTEVHWNALKIKITFKSLIEISKAMKCYFRDIGQKPQIFATPVFNTPVKCVSLGFLNWI